MVCNELYNGQGFGNQLWNYVVARVIADRTRRPFAILGREKYKGQGFMELDFGQVLTGGSSPEGGPPTSLPEGITNYYRERQERLQGSGIDISRTDPQLLAIPPNTKFDGNCQSTKYLEGCKEKIRGWMRVAPKYGQYVPDDNTCMIHLRCGDFVAIKDVFLPITYYQQAIATVRQKNPNAKFACVTDQPEIARKILPEVEVVGSAVTQEDDKLRAAHHKGGPIGIDFSLLMRARYLIIPNSSFSWWAAYLNQRTEIVVAPKYWAAHNISDGYWSTSDIVTDGFTYLDQFGQPFTAEQCWKEKNTYEAGHPEIFMAGPSPAPRRSGRIQERFRKLFRI